MPATDIEKLVVSLEATTTKYERAMQRAVGATNQRMRQIEQRTAKTQSALGNFGVGAFAGLTRGAIGVLAPILSVGAALNTAKAALDQFSSIADNAKSSGLDAERFQELAYQAEQAGVEFDAFSKGLDTFNKNSGLAAENKGRMVTALKALNPELLKNIQSATTQEQRIRLAADAIAAAGSASQRAALSTALFGDAGFKLADAFSGGSKAMDEMAAKAQALGLIVDRDLIAKSEQLGDELSTASQIMDVQFKQALVDLAPVLIATAQLAGGLASAIGYITDSMQELSARGTARLESDLAAIDERLAAANTEYSAGVVGTMGVEIDPAAQGELQAERDRIMGELKRRAMEQLRIGLATPTGGPDLEADTDFGGGGRNAAADATIKQAEAVKGLIEDLQFEQQQLGRNAAQQEYYNLLKSAGVTAESEYGQAILASLTPLQRQRSAIEANAEAMEELGQIASSALDSLVDGLLDGRDAGEVLNNVLGDIGKQFLKLGINTLLGGLGGGFGGGGGLFGFASGTANTGGKRGEPRGIVHGQEAVIPLPSGGRVPVELLAPPIPSPVASGGNIHVTVGVAADSAGNLTPFVERVVQTGIGRAAPMIVATSVKQASKAAPGALAKFQSERGGDYR